jgi:hypothetical protein
MRCFWGSPNLWRGSPLPERLAIHPQWSSVVVQPALEPEALQAYGRRGEILGGPILQGCFSAFAVRHSIRIVRALSPAPINCYSSRRRCPLTIGSSDRGVASSVNQGGSR